MITLSLDSAVTNHDVKRKRVVRWAATLFTVTFVAVTLATVSFVAGAPVSSHTAAIGRHRLTRSQLLVLQSRVGRQAPALMHAGVRLISWGPGIGTDWLENIGVENLTRSQRKLLEKRFGKTNVHIFNIAPADVPITT